MSSGENLLRMFLRHYMLRVQEYDLDTMIAIVGDRGSGKSTLSLRMAELLTELRGSELMFDPAENVYYDIHRLQEDLLKLRKTVMIVDEAAIQLFSRDFATDVNKEIVKTVQISRDQNDIVIWVFPHFMHLDKGVRLYMHHVWRTRVQFLRGGGKIHLTRPYMVQTDYIHDKYRVVPAEYLSEYGDYRPAPWITWNLPREDWWKIYHQKKQEFKKRLVASTSQIPKKMTAREFIESQIRQNPDLIQVLQKKHSRERSSIIKKWAEETGYHLTYLYKVVSNLPPSEF